LIKVITEIFFVSDLLNGSLTTIWPDPGVKVTMC